MFWEALIGITNVFIKFFFLKTYSVLNNDEPVTNDNRWYYFDQVMYTNI